MGSPPFGSETVFSLFLVNKIRVHNSIFFPLSSYSSKGGSSYTEGIWVTRRVNPCRFFTWDIRANLTLFVALADQWQCICIWCNEMWDLIKAKLSILNSDDQGHAHVLAAYRLCPEKTFQMGWSDKFDNHSLMMMMMSRITFWRH